MESNWKLIHEKLIAGDLVGIEALPRQVLGETEGNHENESELSMSRLKFEPNCS
jgi:hypothetical protein